MANQQLSMSPLEKRHNKLQEKRDKLELELMKIDEEISTLLDQLTQQALPYQLTMPQGPGMGQQAVGPGGMVPGMGPGGMGQQVAIPVDEVEPSTGEYRFTI